MWGPTPPPEGCAGCGGPLGIDPVMKKTPLGPERPQCVRCWAASPIDIAFLEIHVTRRRTIADGLRFAALRAGFEKAAADGGEGNAKREVVGQHNFESNAPYFADKLIGEDLARGEEETEGGSESVAATE